MSVNSLLFDPVNTSIAVGQFLLTLRSWLLLMKVGT